MIYQGKIIDSTIPPSNNIPTLNHLPSSNKEKCRNYYKNSEIYIILSMPQLGENIGACARAMKNFGITKLRIISPRDGWPNTKAISASAGADDIINSALIYNDIKTAIEDLDYLYATTSVKRYMNKDYILAQDLKTEFVNCRKVGILFGRENWGLSNEDISYANKIITIDTNPDFTSLNIAQSVMIVCYELFKSSGRSDLANLQDLANKEDLEYFCKILFESLNDKGFFRIPEKQDRMKMNIRNIFARIDKLSKSELKTLMGIISYLK